MSSQNTHTIQKFLTKLILFSVTNFTETFQISSQQSQFHLIDLIYFICLHIICLPSTLILIIITKFNGCPNLHCYLICLQNEIICFNLFDNIQTDQLRGCSMNFEPNPPVLIGNMQI